MEEDTQSKGLPADVNMPLEITPIDSARLEVLEEKHYEIFATLSDELAYTYVCLWK